MKPAIRVENLAKQYRIGTRSADSYRTLRESVMQALAGPFRRLRQRGQATTRQDQFWALRDVSFEVQPGEVVGIIGRNGAGKSTLLKILSRVVEPTRGRAMVRGRMGSLLEVGTGFHPELTGRENIYLNGSILGMSRREINRRFDEIVRFSEIEEFVDTPVKRYSSGMYVRLAFAVAAHLEPEILIVDEVLAVGDLEFQRKCMTRMQHAAQSGHTVILVSHNMAAIENLCTRVATLKAGRMVGFGSSHDQIRQYIGDLRSLGGERVKLERTASDIKERAPILTELQVSVDGTPGTVLPMGGRLSFSVSYSVEGRPRALRIGIVLESHLGHKVVAFSPTFECPNLLVDAPSAGTVRVDVPWINLVEGIYFVSVYAECNGASEAFERASQLTVIAKDVFGTGRTLARSIASTYLPCSWQTSW